MATPSVEQSSGVAMSIYVLITILRKRQSSDNFSLWQISQVLSQTRFEKTPVNSLFLYEKPAPGNAGIGKQLSCLDL